MKKDRPPVGPLGPAGAERHVEQMRELQRRRGETRRQARLTEQTGVVTPETTTHDDCPSDEQAAVMTAKESTHDS